MGHVDRPASIPRSAIEDSAQSLWIWQNKTIRFHHDYLMHPRQALVFLLLNVSMVHAAYGDLVPHRQEQSMLYYHGTGDGSTDHDTRMFRHVPRVDRQSRCY